MSIKIYAKLGSLPTNVFWVKYKREAPKEGEYIKIKEVYPTQDARWRPWKEAKVDTVEYGFYKLDLV